MPQHDIISLLSCFCHAYHTKYEQKPVFVDNYAKAFFSGAEYENIKSYILKNATYFVPDMSDILSDDGTVRFIVNNILAPFILCRSAYCENTLRTAIRTGTNQYVILGSGFDIFSLREKGLLSECNTFVVNSEASLDYELDRIEEAGLKIAPDIKYCAVDFSKNELEEKLIRAGFNPHKKTFFSLLGSSYLLSASEMATLLGEIRRISSNGSTLIFDYADSGMFLSDIPRVHKIIELYEASGKQMKSSYDFLSIESLLSKYGFSVYEVLTPKDIQTQIIDSVGSGLRAFEHVCFMQSVIRK